MSETAVRDVELKPQKKPFLITLPYKIVIGVFIAVLVFLANQDYKETGKSATQLQYENWLVETEAKSRAAINNEALPTLSLTILPLNAADPIQENVINPNNVSDSKDKILRLISLIDEAGLCNFQKEKPSPQPGDIVLKIQGADKTFHLIFKPRDIDSNIKATLTLKLFEEYLKDRIPENLAKKAEPTGVANLKDSIFQLFEDQSNKQPLNEN